MARRLRYLPKPYTLVEVTCRTLQGFLLLRPGPQLNDLALGVIGRARSLYDVHVHLIVIMSNHLHMILAPRDVESLAKFMNYVDGNLAREAGRLYDWHDKFWAKRYAAIPIIDDESLLGRVHYLLSQGCKEGLVARPGDWPGVNCVKALVDGDKLVGTWVDRTKMSEASRADGSRKECDFSTRYEVPLTPLPCFADLTPAQRTTKWREMVAAVETETAERLARENRRVVGAAWVLRQDPHSRPADLAKRPQPLCHAATKVARMDHRGAYNMFVAAYRAARGLFLRQPPAAIYQFPTGSYVPPFVPLPPAPN
jgi:REP element-mobilizing transposase RayT